MVDITHEHSMRAALGRRTAKRYMQYRPFGMTQWCTGECSIEDLASESEAAEDNGDGPLEVRFVAMTPDEYEALEEFGGW